MRDPYLYEDVLVLKNTFVDLYNKLIKEIYRRNKCIIKAQGRGLC